LPPMVLLRRFSITLEHHLFLIAWGLSTFLLGRGCISDSSYWFLTWFEVLCRWLVIGITCSIHLITSKPLWRVLWAQSLQPTCLAAGRRWSRGSNSIVEWFLLIFQLACSTCRLAWLILWGWSWCRAPHHKSHGILLL
jgi:hypothetical protein